RRRRGRDRHHPAARSAERRTRTAFRHFAARFTAMKYCFPEKLVAGIGWTAPFLLLSAGPAMAQSLTLDMGEGGSSTGHIVQLLMLLTVLSLAPAILITVTSFTRIVVVLSFLRN